FANQKFEGLKRLGFIYHGLVAYLFGGVVIAFLCNRVLDRPGFILFGQFVKIDFILLSLYTIAFPSLFVLMIVKGNRFSTQDRLPVFITSVLFIFIGVCLLVVPWFTSGTEVEAANLLVPGYALQLFAIAVILFSPLQQLTRRLSFVVLGVL